MKIIFLYLFSIVLFIYGSYLTIAAIRNWRGFIDAPKRINLFKIFGEFARVVYAVFGLILCACAIVLFLKATGRTEIA